jgi:hypothetical protein
MSLFRSRLMAVAFLLCGISGVAFAAAAADGLQSFLSTYRCAVIERLELTHARAGQSGKDEFVILAPRSARERYVQCIFHDKTRRFSAKPLPVSTSLQCGGP